MGVSGFLDSEERETFLRDVSPRRSLSGTIIQGTLAAGGLAYGVGHLAEGVAKVKEAFGSEKDSTPQPEPPSAPND